MKLSEAMRKGSKMARQSFGRWGGNGDGCALSLAALGAGLITPYELGSTPFVAYKYFGSVHVVVEPPCGCALGEGHAWSVIQHVNDAHLWPAERIAGWIEAQLETPTYSMLDMQQFMGNVEGADMTEVACVR